MAIDLVVGTARPKDAQSLVALINSAYRANRGIRGWTHEVALFGQAPRIDAPQVRDLLAEPDSVLLKCVTPANQLVGCVHLRTEGDRLYLGLLSVAPEAQNQGIGKRLLDASEAHAAKGGARAIYMTVISERTELVEWYLRHGYKPTGQREAVPASLAAQADRALEFLVLEKQLPARS